MSKNSTKAVVVPPSEPDTLAILTEVQRALNKATNFKYSSRIGLSDSYGLATVVDREIKTYTVILLYPDYASHSYGQEHYIDVVEASAPNIAVVRAKHRAFDANKDSNGDSRINDPDDFYVVAVMRGRAHFEDAE